MVKKKFKVYVVEITAYNKDTNEVIVIRGEFGKSHGVNAVKRFLKEKPEYIKLMYLNHSIVETYDVLYVMDEETFKEHAKEVTE